jgi:Ala-tRNA(Pro) deacylase
MDRTALLEFLSRNEIDYIQYDHPAVYTCEQVSMVCPVMPGVGTKNLFLRDKKGHFLLVMTSCERRVNLKLLAGKIGLSKLHFASEELLQAILGVDAGAVTIFGLVNDIHHQVELYVDEEVWKSDTFQSHPLVNTATLVLSKVMLQRFLELTNHQVNIYHSE